VRLRHRDPHPRPLLADKLTEPPVVAVAEDGSVAVPLLGGHRGANALARRIAELTGAVAAVTTASDLRLGVALDEPPPGHVLANPEHAKPFAARLIAGEPVRLEGTAPWLEGLQQSAAASLAIAVTTSDIQGTPDRLVFHRRCLALGVGCERGVNPDELIGLVRDTLAAHKLSPRPLPGCFRSTSRPTSRRFTRWPTISALQRGSFPPPGSTRRRPASPILPMSCCARSAAPALPRALPWPQRARKAA
jgi:hypothetical protein